MPDVESAGPAGDVGIPDDVDRAAVGEQVVPLGLPVEFVDPLEIHEEQPPRGLRRNGQVVEKHFLVAVVGAQADQVALFADDVDEFILLEHRRQRRIAFVRLRTRLDRDAERRSVVEHEAQERVPDGAFHPERHVEIHAGQMRQRHFALQVARREVVPAPVVEIANSRDAHAVAVDRRRAASPQRRGANRGRAMAGWSPTTRTRRETVPRAPSACAVCARSTTPRCRKRRKPPPRRAAATAMAGSNS